MGLVKSFQCDHPGCAQIRTPSNHWFAVFPAYVDSIETPKTVFCAFDPAEYDLYLNMKVFCGETHALHYISAELSKL